MQRALIFAICGMFGGASAACSSDAPSQTSAGAGASGAAASAGASSAGASGTAAIAGSAGALTPALGTPGVWEEVTSPKMDPKLFSEGNFGVGSIVTERIAQGSGGIVWGSSQNLYAMWGWACSACGLDEGGPQYQTAQQPGDVWSKGTLPAALVWGPNSVATTSDGKRTIFVGSMWATGLWRYVEP